jgi:hypothetical protein
MGHRRNFMGRIRVCTCMIAVSRLKTSVTRAAVALLLAAPFVPVVALVATTRYGFEKQRTQEPQRRRQTKRLVLAIAPETNNPRLMDHPSCKCKNLFT